MSAFAALRQILAKSTAYFGTKRERELAKSTRRPLPADVQAVLTYALLSDLGDRARREDEIDGAPRTLGPFVFDKKGVEKEWRVTWDAMVEQIRGEQGPNDSYAFGRHDMALGYADNLYLWIGITVGALLEDDGGSESDSLYDSTDR